MSEAERWVTLLVVGDQTYAEILHSALEAHHVPARIEGQVDRAVLGFTSGLALQVPEDRCEEAREVLDALEGGVPVDEGPYREPGLSEEQGAEAAPSGGERTAEPAATRPMRRSRKLGIAVALITAGAAAAVVWSERRGDDGCAAIIDCAGSCPPDRPGCVEACFREGSVAARDEYERLESCLARRCPDDPDADPDCMDRECPEEASRCGFGAPLPPRVPAPRRRVRPAWPW